MNDISYAQIETDEDVILELESSDDDGDERFNNAPPLSAKIFGITVAFLLTFRVAYNVPDRAIAVLLQFFKHLFLAIGTAYGVAELQNRIEFPLSIHGCYSFVNLDAEPYNSYIVCPSCNMLYGDKVEPLILGTSSNPESARCSFIEFPDHPQARFRLPCNRTLLQKINRNGKLGLKPRKMYYYFGIKRALSVLFARPKFLNMCNMWHQTKGNRTFFADITDGRVWNEICSKMSPNGNPSNIIGILVNIDWFQPYKHVAHSTGVIYGVIRSLRNKDENAIAIGVIPGPHEPKKHINSFLGPFVSEMSELQSGLWFSTSIGKQFVRCVVIGLSSDIPATRKAAGFLGHSASKGCSRCLKHFPKVSDRMNFSGFDRESWPPRTHAMHCEQAYKTLTAKTKKERKEIEKTYGTRYSVLYELSYYDAIRFPIIDAMHNLFLGTAKTMMTIWKEREIVTKEHFTAIQEKIECVNVPIDVGRIPHKIESGMAGLTADQWKNWTCIYSMYVLKDILPSEHLRCWWLFVQASALVCQPLIYGVLALKDTMVY